MLTREILIAMNTGPRERVGQWNRYMLLVPRYVVSIIICGLCILPISYQPLSHSANDSLSDVNIFSRPIPRCGGPNLIFSGARTRFQLL
jgi:hypothetical protein